MSHMWNTNGPHNTNPHSDFKGNFKISCLIGLSLIKRPILINCLNLKLIQIGQKVPLPTTSFNVGQIVGQKLLKAYFHTPVNTFHAPLKSMLRLMIPKSWAEQFPPLSEIGSIHFMKFSATLLQLAEKPPPLSSQTGKHSETGSIHFMQFPATLVQLAEKPSPTPTH